MSSQGPNFPGTAENDAAFAGSTSWSNATLVNAKADDGAVATVALPVGEESRGLKLTNYGFTIPAGATINGILVEVKRSASASGRITDSKLQLIGVTGFGIADKADLATAYTTTLTYISYGGASDLWSATPTVAEINSSGFGVEFTCVNSLGASTTTGRVDTIRITVFYTPAGGGATFQVGCVKATHGVPGCGVF